MSIPLQDTTRDLIEAPGGGDTETGSGTVSPASHLVEAFVAAWRQGERPAAEAFLARHGDLGAEAALRLIYEEVCLRQEAGMAVDPAEVVGRFPQWRAELEILLDCQRLIQPQRPTATFPEVGEVLGGFRLLAELGRGASGRIFLASQPSLADRPVVLKVTASGQEEHLSLARLQHMNIVPLYSEQVLLTRNLRILCMPYLGNATLARLLEVLRVRPPGTRTGKHLVEALDLCHSQAALPVSLPTQGPYRGTLARSSYVQAIGWIGACLADGMQYAHDRGLVHMDVKPSNVLLTGDGQPMLLDFHLARGPILPDGPPPPRLGGTPDYASPEQRAAMGSVRQGRPIRVPVDGRSDMYSLGVMLYEALGGSRPARGADSARAPLHRLNPQVSLGLSDIVEKCLRPDPRQRYPDAAALATDLRRHLNHLPLVGVPNRSVAERWRKWRRRRPSALPRQIVLLVSMLAALAAAVPFLTASRQRSRDLDTALRTGRTFREQRQYDQAALALERGLALAGDTSASLTRRHALDLELRRVKRDRQAAELHQIAELIRFQTALAPQPTEEAWSLIDRGRRIWESRRVLTRPLAGSGQGQGPGQAQEEIEPAIRTDLLDVVTVCADLRVRLAPPGELEPARREALQWTGEAVALLGSSPSIERLRRAYREALGESGTVADPLPVPRTAWEHCDLGRSYLRSGDLAAAAEQFQEALDLRPQDFWPNFYQGVCAYRLGRFDDAIDAFRVCIALAPERAECYFNRGLAHEALGQTARALGNYNHALQFDRRLTAAALNRGLLHHAAGRELEAAADLDRALATASDRETRGVIQYNRALIDLARGDRPAARSSLKAAVGAGSEKARDLLERLQP
jgi:serine/threonine protein kinase/Flp pilus assembly protein TadD